MTNPMRVPSEARRILLFIGAGVVNTIFGFGVYALVVWAGLAPASAVIVSTVAGVAFNFRTLGAVFAAHGLARLPRFLVTYTLLAPLNIGLLRIFHSAGADHYLSEALALGVVVPLTYFAMRVWVFAPNRGRTA